MGIYMSSKIMCLDCENYNTFDTSSFFAPEPLEYLIKNKPRIVCGGCGSEKIQASDHSFFSFDMSMSDAETIWKPENLELVWTMPDCKQGLSEIIWLDIVFEFQHSKNETKPLRTSRINFFEFDRYEKYKPGTKGRPSVPFKRVRHVDELHDLYAAIPETYRQYRFLAMYMDRVPKGTSYLDVKIENPALLEVPADWDVGDDNAFDMIEK